MVRAIVWNYPHQGKVLIAKSRSQVKASLTRPYRFGWFDWFCLWYPPGWLILLNRHWQHYKPDPDGWNWLEYGLFLLPGGFYLALAVRWLRLGGRQPRAIVGQPDPTYQQAFQQEILQPIAKYYFRGKLVQPENLPVDGPVIVAMNHAGMCFPWDFVMLGWLLGQQREWFVQPLAHPIFFEHPWLVWWLPGGWAHSLGGVRADRQSFEAAIATQTILLYAPEGWRGLVKGWHQRYQLTTFDPSFIRLSRRYRVPILPIVCLGSESLHPLTFNLAAIAKWLKLPLFPISPLVLVFLLFPSMGVWAMRTRLRYHVQPLWHPWEQPIPENTSKNIATQPEQSRVETEQRVGDRQSKTNRAIAYRLADQLRSHLQTVIDQWRQAARR